MNRHPSTNPVANDNGRPHVLFVDDDELVRKAFRRSMRRRGMSLTIAADPLEALQLWREGDFDVLVTDLNMAGMTGLQLIEAIHAECGHEAFVVLSGVGVLETRCGVPGVRYVPKPWNADQLADAIYALGGQSAVARAG